MNDIVKISKLNYVQIGNTHNEHLYPLQSVLIVEYRNKKQRIIDLVSNRDITSIDYFKVIRTNKTKEKILFKEESEEE